MPDLDPKEYTVGSSSMVMGCDSYTKSDEIQDNEVVMAMNCVCRGGIYQTRPGTKSLYCLPKGNLQGFTLFTPDNGVAQQVAAVDGVIYVSPAPFTAWRRLKNVQFSPASKYIAWTVTLKSVTINNAGEIVTLANPYSILIMQDGVTRAAYWDGGNSGHLNPSSPPDVTDDTVVPGYNQTPVGLWSIWSGNRLWVSRGNQIFSGDIGDPISFTETLYLNEGRAFYLSGPCTGMIELPADSSGAKGFIAFTEKDGTLFQSNIQDRTTWLATPLFQNTILPNVGCVAPRSLITQYGLNWWFAPRGFTNLNAAFRQNLSSRIDYQDNEMFASKAYLGPDLSQICAGFYENYTMVSVPSGDVLNRHTWVLDQAPFEGNANAWPGYWTGWRPVEWGMGLVNGSSRIFFASKDYDGNNRVWEAMQQEKTDNGCRITSFLQLKEHAAGNLYQKRYDWSKLFLSQIYGEVDLAVYVASTKGGFQLQKNFHIVASEGQIFDNVSYSDQGPLMVGNRVQTRTIKTTTNQEDNDCNRCGVESVEGNMIDYAFSNLLVWSGQMGVKAYQMFFHDEPERLDGDCEEDEVAPRTLNEAGCSALEIFVDGQVFKQYTAIAEGAAFTSDGRDIYIRQSSVSVISDANAKDLAECAVQQTVNALSGRELEGGVYGTDEAIIGQNTYVVIDGIRVSCPEITSQPESQSIFAGDGTSFSVGTLAVDAIYRWQKSTDSGVNWSDISDDATYSGADSTTLTVTDAQLAMDGIEYRLIVSHASCRSLVSDSATLSVANPCEGVVNWTARTPPSTTWIKVVWADTLNLFVAIKQNSVANSIMTSPDGITWTQRSQPTTGSPFWDDLTWSSHLGLLVAVAESGTSRVMTSTDGINWTLRTAANASPWKRVQWIPDLNIFVAGANSWAINQNLMTSPDGINWTLRNTPLFQSRGFAWSSSLGLIVAISDVSPYVLTSPDGITWTTRSISGTPQFTGISWSPSLGLFVGTSSVDPLLLRSTDGINWTGYNASFPHGLSDFMRAIEWSPQLATFAMLGKDSNTGKVVFSSKDGLAWTERTCPNPTNGWSSLAWSPALGYFTAIAGSGTNLAMTSSPCP